MVGPGWWEGEQATNQLTYDMLVLADVLPLLKVKVDHVPSLEHKQLPLSTALFHAALTSVA